MSVALEQPEGVLDGVDQRPVEIEQLASRATREDDTSHRSARAPALGQLPTQFLERHGLVPRKLGQTGLERGESVGV